MDLLSDQLQRSTLHSSGERALSVFLDHSSMSEQINRDICRLRAYVPCAVHTEDDFMARQTAITELERELCDAARSQHMLALVSKETWRAVRPPPATEYERIWVLEHGISKQLRRLMCLMAEYGCGDDTIDIQRNTRHYLHMLNRQKRFGGDESKILMPQKTCHEWRSYRDTDHPRQLTLDLITTLRQGLNIYMGGINDNGIARENARENAILCVT